MQLQEFHLKALSPKSFLIVSRFSPSAITLAVVFLPIQQLSVSNEVVLLLINQAMKDFFSRYKFDGDFLLRKVFASVFK